VIFYQKKKGELVPLTPELYREEFKIEYTNNLLFTTSQLGEKIQKRCVKRLLKKEEDRRANRWALAMY